MPDWRGAETQADGCTLAPGAKKKLSDRARQFFARKTVIDKKKFTPLKQRLTASRNHMMALDKALRCTLGNAGLKEFRCKSFVSPLKVGQRRFYAFVESLSEDLRMAGGVRSRRSCLAEEGPPNRFEVVWTQPRPVLVAVVDMGSIGFPSKPWLVGGMGCLRG